MTQKPKYEIDQKVYLKDDQVTIYGIKRLLDGNIAYNLEGYPNELFIEDKLSLTPPDDKRYYILYRSLDGLEKRELAYVNLGGVTIFSPIKSPIGAPPVRKYTYQNTETEDDGKTVVYVYEEV